MAKAKRLHGHSKSPLNTGKAEMPTRGNHLDKVQRAYAAGIIDGEGCISLYKNKSETCVRGFRHRASVAMTNTDLRLVRRFQAWFGGTVHTLKERRNSHMRKTCYQWRLNSISDMENCLSLIEPFLFIKRKQAQVVQEFLTDGGKGYGGKGVSEEEWERRQRLLRQMQRLNKRGVEPQRLSEENKATQSLVSDSPALDELQVKIS